MNSITTGDLADVKNFNPLVRGMDVIIHLAAKVHVNSQSPNDDAAYANANTYVTERIATAAATAKITKFIFLSTVKVYGEKSEIQNRLTEKTLPNPIGPYSHSKYAAEQAVTSIATNAELPWTILRIPLVYGPGVRANFHSLIRLCDSLTVNPLAGITENRRSLLFIENLTDGIEAIVKKNTKEFGLYLLSDGEDVSTAELVRRLKKSLNRRQISLPVPKTAIRLLASVVGRKEAAERLCNSLSLDSSLFNEKFEWTPPYSVDQGIAATTAWYRTTSKNQNATSF